MKKELQTICENFIKNRDVIVKEFSLHSNYIMPVCANIFCTKNQLVTKEQLVACNKLLKSRTGLFSNFRGEVQVPIVSMLAASANPEEYVGNILKNYDTLKAHFHRSSYLVLVAAILADMVSVVEAEEKAVRGENIYKRMKQEHPFLTSSEDSVLAVLMAFSAQSDDELIEEMEQSYSQLKHTFSNSNAVQSVSHVLTLGEGTSKQKTAQVVALFNSLQQAGVKYGKHYELSTLAAVSLLSDDIDTLTKEILEVDAFLSTQKGYGLLGIDKKTRLMNAAMLVSDLYAQRDTVDAVSITSTLALVAAQEAAMCAAMAASMAACSNTTN